MYQGLEQVNDAGAFHFLHTVVYKTVECPTPRHELEKIIYTVMLCQNLFHINLFSSFLRKARKTF